MAAHLLRVRSVRAPGNCAAAAQRDVRRQVARHVYPKSTSTLRRGDFCFISRDDGRAALFVYLYPQRNSRSYFFGALALQTAKTADLSVVAGRLTLGERALLHIKCFRENQTPIAGNLLDRLDSSLIDEMLNIDLEGGIGHTTRVWGWSTVLHYANALAA